MDKPAAASLNRHREDMTYEKLTQRKKNILEPLKSPEYRDAH